MTIRAKRAAALKARQLFRPKLPELPTQCVSCPFLEGNDPEWRGLIRRLCAKAETVNLGAVSAHRARALIHGEATMNGEFACHNTVYTPEMEMRDRKEHRQCPGATKWFKEHLP